MSPTITFAHVTFNLAAEYESRGLEGRVFTARTEEDLEQSIGETDILCVGGLWRSELLNRAPKLRLLHTISAGVDNLDIAALLGRNIRVCSASGVNAVAVAEHALALMLTATRNLAMARDRQNAKQWLGIRNGPRGTRGELNGKTLVLLGYGAIGAKIAMLARAFGMRIIVVRRSAAAAEAGIDAVVGTSDFQRVLPEADFICLAAPLNAETKGIVDAEALTRMRPAAWLINVARGAVVVEPALIEALQSGRIAGAALDCFAEEPLPTPSPLWSMPNVIVSPHVAGDTDRYESGFIDLFVQNIDRLEKGQPLINEITAPL